MLQLTPFAAAATAARPASMHVGVEGRGQARETMQAQIKMEWVWDTESAMGPT
jgi:hypothetical protein